MIIVGTPERLPYMANVRVFSISFVPRPPRKIFLSVHWVGYDWHCVDFSRFATILRKCKLAHDKIKNLVSNKAISYQKPKILKQ